MDLLNRDLYQTMLWRATSTKCIHFRTVLLETFVNTDATRCRPQLMALIFVPLPIYSKITHGLSVPVHTAQRTTICSRENKSKRIPSMHLSAHQGRREGRVGNGMQIQCEWCLSNLLSLFRFNECQTLDRLGGSWAWWVSIVPLRNVNSRSCWSLPTSIDITWMSKKRSSALVWMMNQTGQVTRDVDLSTMQHMSPHSQSSGCWIQINLPLGGLCECCAGL